MQQLRIDSDLDSLRLMSSWLVSACKSLGCSEEVCFRFEVAANEAVANAINYGYPRGISGKIELRIERMEDDALLEIEDDGRPFNPLDLHEPLAASTLEQKPIGGLGVLLIRRSMAKCEYCSRNGRNVLRLKSPVEHGSSLTERA